MKKAFEILAYTMLELVISILLLTGLYCLLSSFILNTAGSSVEFSFSYIWLIILRFTPACSIFSITILIFNFIKRNCTFGESIVSYAIITALVWIVLVPLCIMNDNGTIPGFMWWIQRMPSEGDSAALFKLPAWTSHIIIRFEVLHEQLAVFFQGSLLSFGTLQYASFFLSLAAIGCFARFSSWRLWNAFFVVFAFCAGVMLNSYMFDASYMSSFGLNEFWSKWLPLFVNAFIFLFNTGLGVLLLILKKHREGR